MSITGIDKVKSTSTIFVDVSSKGMINDLSTSSSFLNAEFGLSLNYTNNTRSFINRSVDTKNTEMTLSNPSTNFVNLSFAFTNVSSNLQDQNAASLLGNSASMNVKNSLTYSHSSNKASLKAKDVSSITVLSTNSEYEITLNLNGTSLPEVNVYYPNVEERVDIELDGDVVWS